jgi:hypothetical protein
MKSSRFVGDAELIDVRLDVDELRRENAALLAAMLAELRAIRVAIEHPPKNSHVSLSRADRDILARLLPAIGGAFGSELFLAADVIESDSPAVRPVRGKLTAKSLGKLLKRSAGVPVAGYLITAEGTEAGSLLWRVRQVVDSRAL